VSTLNVEDHQYQSAFRLNLGCHHIDNDLDILTNSQMRILVVMTHYPFPPRVGSTIIAYNSMKCLSKHHIIDLICIKPESSIVESAEFVKRLKIINQRKLPKFAMWIRYLFYMMMGVPPHVSAFVSSTMKEKVKEALRSRNYDVLLLFEMNAIQYCPSSSYHKLIVHIEDPLAIKQSRMAKLSSLSLWQKGKLLLSSKLANSYENRLLPMMSKVLLLSESDMHDLYEQGGYDNLSIVTYGVDQKDLTEIVAFEDRECAIIFSGNMNHLPNVDGVLFFLRDIFPLILMQCQSVKLWIVGADPDDRVAKASARFGKQVLITGRVDDVSYYLKRATVSVCPVRLKIGVQTKILEALSWGTPVVSTSEGNSGIRGLSGSQLWIEDLPTLFAKRVVQLLQGNGWSELSEEGRRLASERFSWEDSAAQLERQLNLR
jgi:glycosyltransferase involved in cell wall biosynthesis